MNGLNLKSKVMSVTILLLLVSVNIVATAQNTISQDLYFPELTGQYQVGITSFEWLDESRDETFASIPGLNRDLMVYVWFPATLGNRTRVAPYMQGDTMWNIWSGHTGQDQLVHSHAYRTTILDPDKPSYPVIIFAPCLFCISLNYSSIMEEIASHGYIVIGTSHPYSTRVIEYPDGRMLIGRNPSEDANMQATWTEDIGFVLDQVELLNATDNSFQGHLDLSHIGVIGHFFAGPVAAQITAIDQRIKAGVSLSSNASSTDVGATPFLFVGTAYPTQQAQDKYLLHIDGATSLNYSDFGLLLPLVPEVEQIQGAALGSIEPVQGIQIVNSYLVTFFDHYLKSSDLNWAVYDEANLSIIQQ